MSPARLAIFLFLGLSSILAFGQGADEGAAERVELLAGKKGSRELVYRGKDLVAERSYDLGGHLLEERFLGADALPYETREYIRAGGRLLRVEARDGSDIAIGSMSYRYDRSGRLLGVETEGGFGSGGAGMLATEDGPQGSWTTDGETRVFAYDESGRTIGRQVIKDGETASIEARSYDEKGSLSSISRMDKKDGGSELSYDAAGRLVLRKESVGGIESATSYSYDEKGRLVEESTKAGEHESSVSRLYAPDGSLERRETRRDGELLLAVLYVEGERVEELYDDGLLFVRASYKDGRKVKDEFFAEGELLRTREYQ